jgi:AhpD family alkylhydroperoxidase
MMPRLDYGKVAPRVSRALATLQATVNSSGLEPSLLELVKTRASQINGCAYCVTTHTRDARAKGETEQRLYLLPVWREAPCYSDRERAALAWTEAVTLVADGHVPDGVFEEVRMHFSDEELTWLTLAVVAINGWNRFGVAFRLVPEIDPRPLPDRSAAPAHAQVDAVP